LKENFDIKNEEKCKLDTENIPNEIGPQKHIKSFNAQ
jgi:hypothetical protein